jgi:hypothetical protein
MEFNIQDYLRDMREEQQQDHRDLAERIESHTLALHGRVSSVNERVNKHETRLVVVENTRKTLLWLGTALITALLGFVGDMLINHLPHVAAAAVVKVGESK